MSYKQPLPVMIVYKNRVSPFDATGTVNLVVGTVKNTLMMLGAGFILEAVSGLTTPPTASMGTNSSSYDNLMGATALTPLTTALNVWSGSLLSQYPILNNGLESCHVEYNKALVDMEGDVSYVEISPHRQVVSKSFADELKSESFGARQIEI